MNCSHLQDIECVQFMPVLGNKLPIHSGWQKQRKLYNMSNCEAVGIVCGELSGNLQAIDLDLKYDLTGKLFDKYKKSINAVDKSLLSKLTVQKTVSGGYHFIFRCEEIEGNKKLARRYANDTEKAKGEKIKVLIETRGEGGYIACDPTPGYKLTYGSYETIQTITPEEKEILFECARKFNEVIEVFTPQRTEKKQLKGMSPFEDYNNRADVIALLESHGWQAVGQKGSKTLLKRPGDSSARHSGNFDSNKNWFSVFSTSTEFEDETPYLPYAVYAFLECNKDFKEASKKLYDLGFGDRLDKAKEQSASVPSKIDLTNDDVSFLATKAHYTEYLSSWRLGTFKMGLRTGIPALDSHFRFKESNLVVINGHDNVGKSVVIWFLSLLSAMHHKWKWIIFSSENSVGSVYRKLIEFFWCESIASMSDEKYNEALDFVEKNYSVILSEEELYNYKDILNMTKKILSKDKKHGLLIDPYNSLKIELTGASKLSTHEYHYEALSDIKLFGKQNNLSIYVNCHAVTTALRQKDSDGMAMAPQKADTEGGGKFANKADEFLTIHRKTQHVDDWNVTELHVRKIKETETGGKVTSFDEPIKLRMVSGGVGFEYESLNGEKTNPIHLIHGINQPKTYTPYKDEEEVVPF